jgi:hypothetical protein
MVSSAGAPGDAQGSLRLSGSHYPCQKTPIPRVDATLLFQRDMIWPPLRVLHDRNLPSGPRRARQAEMSVSNSPTVDSILGRIAWAEACFGELAERLRADARIAGLLDRLNRATHRSHDAMTRAGVVAECANCEQQEGGSCCGAGLEDRYDGVTLLINLLLGTDLPHERGDPRGCLFLGPHGCALRARDVICINYLCRKVADKLTQPEVEAMHECEGEEIESLFRLHALLTAVLRETVDA